MNRNEALQNEVQPWDTTFETVQLDVPETPSVIDLAQAYLRKLISQSENAGQEVFDAELAAANAERIAAAKRAKAERLANQIHALEQQIKTLRNNV